MPPRRPSRSVPPQPDFPSMPSYELYIVRHAIAADRGDEWPDDTKRPLTTRGINRFKDGLGGLKWLEVSIDEIFSSPLVRAKQTADLLSAGVPGTPPVKLLDALAPGHTPSVVMAQLAKAAKRQRIALVGHEPDLGEWVSYCLSGQPRGAIELKKAGACLLHFDGPPGAGTGRLRWLLTSGILRRL